MLVFSVMNQMKPSTFCHAHKAKKLLSHSSDVWLVATCLMIIWEERQAGKVARLVQCQAEIQARILVLKHTRWKHYTLHNSALLLEEMINLHFSQFCNFMKYK